MKERGVFNYIVKSKQKKGVVTKKYIYDLVDDSDKLKNKHCGCCLCISQYSECEEKCSRLLSVLKEKFGHYFFVCPVRYLKDQNLKELYEDEPIDFEINTINEKPGTDI